MEAVVPIGFGNGQPPGGISARYGLGQERGPKSQDDPIYYRCPGSPAAGSLAGCPSRTSA